MTKSRHHRQQQLGGRRRAQRHRRARSSPTTCTCRSACRTSGIARRWRCPIPSSRCDHSAPHRRHAARPPRPGRRQQRPRRVGIHQHRRRLERPGSHRARSARSDKLPDARRAEAVRRLRGNHRRQGRRAARRSRCAGPSGGRSSGRTRAGREYAQRWVAHDADALASDITKPERARTVDELLRRRRRPRHPEPERDDGGYERADRVDDRRRHPAAGVGHDGMTPESWADGTRRWDGYLDRRGVPAHRRSGRRPHLDRERAGRRRRDARDDRRGRLRRRHPRAHDSRSPDRRSTRPRRGTCSTSSSTTRALFLERWRTLLLDNARAPAPHHRRIVERRARSSAAWSRPRGPAAPRRTRSPIVSSRKFRLHVGPRA